MEKRYEEMARDVLLIVPDEDMKRHGWQRYEEFEVTSNDGLTFKAKLM